ncbi:MAG: ABC transporter permease [Nitratireductor sp.]|nr:ABC transporter permease [Nitratireductor sp.]
METIGFFEIIAGVVSRLWPVWLAGAIVFAMSFSMRKRLGLYGQLIGNGIGLTGVLICVFWLFAAIFADIVAPFGARDQLAVMKNAFPGSIDAQSGLIYYLGGDNLGRDVFSRIIHGSRVVLVIAPAATLFALMVGMTLGLPAGYFGGKVDSVLSFLANLVLAFPVILLFYLLVTPGIEETIIPKSLAGFFFLFPIIFFCTLFYTRFRTQPEKLSVYIAVTLLVGGWVYAGLVFGLDPLGIMSLEKGELNIFVAVVFASSPGVFRIVRGLTLDIMTRDYVAAAQTRGEGPWYIMLWEILPNARGPLIVDGCLRIGYTTILLGTLGYFGLGMGPESADWGTMIKDGSQLLRLYVWPALVPALALMSFVLGLNLLADGLREESLKD